MRKLINFVAFQLGWFAAVLGAAHGRAWAGVVVVPLVLALAMFMSNDWKRELKLAAGSAVMGLLFDTTMTSLGAFHPVPHVFPKPISPLWMLMLWVNQATALNSCMAWLNSRYALGALFGAIGGPLAYLGGARLGAAAIPTNSGLLILAAAWALAFPALLKLQTKVQQN